MPRFNSLRNHKRGQMTRGKIQCTFENKQTKKQQAQTIPNTFGPFFGPNHIKRAKQCFFHLSMTVDFLLMMTQAYIFSDPESRFLIYSLL